MSDETGIKIQQEKDAQILEFPVMMHIQFVIVNHRPSDLMTGMEELIKAFYPEKQALGLKIAAHCLNVMAEEGKHAD